MKIGNINPQETSPVYLKILYLALLESLAKCRYDSPKPRERFVSLIREYSGWNERENVSIPHILRLLSKYENIGSSKVRDEVSGKIATWEKHNFPTLKQDLTSIDASKLFSARDFEIMRSEKVNFHYFHHVHLLYNMRNTLFHEFRELGYGLELKRENSPFYFWMPTLNKTPRRWELMYPIGFFEFLVDNSIKNLKGYFDEVGKDPRELYTFGSYWIEPLNK